MSAALDPRALPQVRFTYTEAGPRLARVQLAHQIPGLPFRLTRRGRTLGQLADGPRMPGEQRRNLLAERLSGRRAPTGVALEQLSNELTQLWREGEPGANVEQTGCGLEHLRDQLGREHFLKLAEACLVR